jgi:hypothetical protein
MTRYITKYINVSAKVKMTSDFCNGGKVCMCLACLPHSMNTNQSMARSNYSIEVFHHGIFRVAPMLRVGEVARGIRCKAVAYLRHGRGALVAGLRWDDLRRQGV